ncbi:MAG: hypothetical protein JOZ39_09155, partial [Chloroflexi bacterium]|nr:hypothetical protein [Chloroflexota bacterium]
MDRVAAATPLPAPAWTGQGAASPQKTQRPWLFVGAIAIGAGVYLALLASHTVDGLRGNSEWHIPAAPQTASAWWWLPLPAAAAICMVPLLPLTDSLKLVCAAAANALLGYLLYAAQWGGGDNLLGKILNGSNGFYDAAVHIANLRSTLASYPAYLATFEPASHVPSHPPADVLFFYAINQLTGHWPWLTGVVLQAGRPFISGLPMLLGAGNPPSL